MKLDAISPVEVVALREVSDPVPHTPGPWVLSDVRRSGRRQVEHWTRNHDGHRWRRGVVEILDSNMDDGEPEANARLIATAPDLLDALRAFCGDHEATGFQCAGLNAAYLHAMAVIRKAEGR